MEFDTEELILVFSFLARAHITEIPAQRRPGHSLTACNAAPPATPHCLLNPKCSTSSEKRSNIRLLDPPIKFCKFFDPIIPPMRMSNPKQQQEGPKMAQGVLKGLQPQVIVRSHQILLNRYFNLSTTSMRKVDDGETGKNKEKKGNNHGNSGP